jgi:putative exosortase-associated protein (TIGR04073 family)
MHHSPIHTLLLVVVLILALPSFGQAQTAVDKFSRGFAGMTLGFLELPGNMVRESDRRGAAEGIPLGFAKGLGMIVVRELVGVWEFVSAPFPAPEGYRPIIEPEYPWDYFDGSSSRREARARVERAVYRERHRPTVPY